MASAIEPSLEKQIRDLTFNIERSGRYHNRRQAFYESFDRIVNVANLIFGSVAVGALLDDRLPDWLAGTLTAAVAVISFVNLTMQSSQKAALHSQLNSRFIDLRKQIARLDPTTSTCGKGLTKCHEKRLDIERDEPTTNRLVDILAHNELALAMGKGDDCVYYVPWFKAMTANLWPFYQTDRIVTVKEHNAKKL